MEGVSVAFVGDWHGLPSSFCSSSPFFFVVCVCVCQTKRHSERGRTHTALSSDPSCWGLIFRAVHIRLLEGPENREAAPRAAFGTRPHRGGGGFQRLS